MLQFICVHFIQILMCNIKPNFKPLPKHVKFMQLVNLLKKNVWHKFLRFLVWRCNVYPIFPNMKTFACKTKLCFCSDFFFSPKLKIHMQTKHKRNIPEAFKRVAKMVKMLPNHLFFHSKYNCYLLIISIYLLFLSYQK